MASPHGHGVGHYAWGPMWESEKHEQVLDSVFVILEEKTKGPRVIFYKHLQYKPLILSHPQQVPCIAFCKIDHPVHATLKTSTLLSFAPEQVKITSLQTWLES